MIVAIPAGGRAFRRACTFACCWPVTSRASARSGESPGGAATAVRCRSSSASRPPTKRRTTPVCRASRTETLADSVKEAQVNVQAAGDETTSREAVADKGYHAAKMIELCMPSGCGRIFPSRAASIVVAGRTSRRSFNAAWTPTDGA